MFLQALFLNQTRISEPLVADGLESYVCNQFFPINLNLLMGKKSLLVYYFTESHSRRKGRMNKRQKQRSKHVYEGKSFAESKLSVMFKKLISFLDGRCQVAEVQVHTDLHPVYRSVIADWNRDKEHEVHIDHRCTSSELPRTRDNDLFAVNYFDRLIRKDMPNHRRETACQARNDRNLLSRLAYYSVSHNFFKPYPVSSDAKQHETRHSDMVIGRTAEIGLWKSRLHTYRFFKSFVTLPDYFEHIWSRSTPTPLKEHPDPVPKFAYQ